MWLLSLSFTIFKWQKIIISFEPHNFFFICWCCEIASWNLEYMQSKDHYKLHPYFTIIADNLKSNLTSICVFLGCNATQVWQMVSVFWVTLLPPSCILHIETACLWETFVLMYQTTLCHIPEDHMLDTLHRDKHIFHKNLI